MRKFLAIGLLFFSVSADVQCQSDSQVNLDTDTILTLQNLCLLQVEELTDQMAVVSQCIDSIRSTKPSIDAVETVVSEPKGLREKASPESRLLVDVPANAAITLIDYREGAVPMFQATYAGQIGWTSLKRDEINRDVSAFISKRIRDTRSLQPEQTLNATFLKSLELILTSLLGILTAIGTQFFTGRRRERKANLWSGISQLKRDVLEKCANREKRESPQLLVYINSDTQRHINALGINADLEAYFSAQFDDVSSAMNERNRIVRLLA